MEDTCMGEKCYFWQLTDGKCFNYLESWWTPVHGDGKPKLIKDCAPKRTLLLFQDLTNRMIGVEKSNEELRDECVTIQAFAEVIGRSVNINLEAFVENRRRMEESKKLQKQLPSKVQKEGEKNDS